MSERAFLPSPEGRGAGGEGGWAIPSKPPLPPETLALARQLRKQLTNAEDLYWYLLRDRRFLGLKFRRQHPVPPYVLDFYCRELNLAIELDGGQHNEKSSIEHDRSRDLFLARKGIRVLRYWNVEALAKTDEVLEHLYLTVQELLSSRGASEAPSPRASRGPLPSGEGDKAQ